MLKPFTQHDFDLFSGDKVKDVDFDGPRLELKRKLKLWGDEALARVKEGVGMAFQVQTSLHRPYKHNHYRVDSQRVLLTATAKQKAGLKQLLGDAFKADVSSGVVQMTIGLTISHTGLETALKIHPGAWWDGVAWESAAKSSAEKLSGLLQGLPPDFTLEAGRSPRECNELTTSALAAVMRGYRPAEHWLTVKRFYPRVAMIEGLEDQEGLLLEDLVALAPIYQLVKEFAP